MDQKKYITEKRKWKQISEKERYQLESLLQAGLTPLVIGIQMNRDKRSIEREIKRGSVVQVDSQWHERIVYCADVGQRRHDENAANKGRALKIGNDHALVKHIEMKIKDEKYSPDAIIGEIKEKKIEFIETICTKTLYNYIDRGLFLNISNKDLPVKKAGSKCKYKSIRKVALNNTKGRSIEERPTQLENREELGHWEMDCVVGYGKACLLVLTERKTRKELIFKMASKTQNNVIATMDKLEKKHKRNFSKIFKSITMDNGGEFLDMNGIERSFYNNGNKRTTCYYAHPYSAWERGSNEVANKLIRRFIPKGVNIGKLKIEDIKRIENWINNYPRKIFGYKSANQIAA